MCTSSDFNGISSLRHRVYAAGPLSGNALTLASGRICRLSQPGEHVEESLRLAPEQPHVGQERHRAHGGARRFGWANDRTGRELSIEERTWLRHDQVGLEVLDNKWRRGGRVQ